MVGRRLLRKLVPPYALSRPANYAFPYIASVKIAAVLSRMIRGAKGDTYFRAAL
jgi:hypothetical protein